MKKYLSLFLTMLKIGLFTFGGGYAMIALLENEFVEKKKYMKMKEIKKRMINILLIPNLKETKCTMNN